MTNQRQLAYWLLICCALVFAMVILGGATRLTGSGLSMVEWQPLYGVLPPLNEHDWQTLFEKYRQTPEYRHVNPGMDVAGFKEIFWLEYGHRVLGRVIGLAFLLPFLYFWLSGKIPAKLTPRLITLFALGGLQGLLGWYMVKSGLVDNPHVSQYRLTAHLLLAVLVYGYMLWVALGLLLEPSTEAEMAIPRGIKAWSVVVLGLAVLSIASGGFVAGLHAGMTYNTFPLMAGQWIPDGLFAISPWYLNLFENVTTVQFSHRVLATMTALAVILLWLASLQVHLARRQRVVLNVLLLAVLVQVSLGISTLLLQVPIALASAHQTGALLVFTVLLIFIRLNAVRQPLQPSLSNQRQQSQVAVG